MTRTQYIFPMLCLLGLACSDGEQIEYYEVTGETKIYRPGGEELTEDISMAAVRTLQPSTDTILEQFIDLNEGETTDVTFNIDIETNTFTGSLKHPDSRCDSNGSFQGEAWNWHAWESVSECEQETEHGSMAFTIKSTDTKNEDGIVANKTGYDEDENEFFSQEEILTPITEEAWHALVDEWDALAAEAE